MSSRFGSFLGFFFFRPLSLSLSLFSSLPYVTLQHSRLMFQMLLAVTLRTVCASATFPRRRRKVFLLFCFFIFSERPSLFASWPVGFVICGPHLFRATIEQLFHHHWGPLTAPLGCCDRSHCAQANWCPSLDRSGHVVLRGESQSSPGLGCFVSAGL